VGHISWGKASPDATFKMYKMMMKASNGWQLDGHVSVSGSAAMREGMAPLGLC